MVMALSFANLGGALRALTQNTAALNQTMLRLSTGLAINRASDNPSGLVAAESLRSQIASIEAAQSNANRANDVLDTADAGLEQIGDLLTTVKTLALEAANTSGMTQDEIDANQLQIDSAIESINRIVNTTSFNGQKLLDGSRSYYYSGLNTSLIGDLEIHAVDTSTNSADLTVRVASAAEHAILTRSFAALPSALTLEVRGNYGTETLSFSQGATLTAIGSAVNLVTSATGVSTVISGGKLHFQSPGYGADAFVSVTPLSGTFNLDGSVTYDAGENAGVTVNGQRAATNGLDVNFTGGGVATTFTLTETANVAGTTESFSIDGGGMQFQLGSGLASRISVGIDSAHSSRLGSQTLGYLDSIASGGTNSLTNNARQAALIASEAVTQVSNRRARIGAVQSQSIDTSLNIFSNTLQNTQDALSRIADVDYASEIALFNRQNILVTAGTQVLDMYNTTNSLVLQLLG